MKIEKLTVRKNGKIYSGEIAWPDDLSTALMLLGELEVWSAFKIGYKELAKKRITNSIRPRKRWLKLDLTSVDDQTAELIERLARESARAAFAHEEALRQQQQQQQAEESAQPELQQTYQSDYDETQEEAQDQSFESEGSFEEDFAKYLASLDSSPQPHTEKDLQPN